MKGYGPITQQDVSNKWMAINQIVRENKIAVLALQETHLTAERIETLNNVFASTLHVQGSLDPMNQTGARGVAFVLNKRLIGDLEFTCQEITPGRAILLSLNWRNNQPLKILNIYAPNNPRENEGMWTSLRETWEATPNEKPAIMLGDFNLVESPVDRLPEHGDDRGATDALQALTRTGNMCDGWRRENPTERDYTFSQTSTSSQSRIDRIYISREIEGKTSGWDILGPGVPTDHRMPVAAIANYRTPHVGRGRWSMPTSLLHDQHFMDKAALLGRKLNDDLQDMVNRTPGRNPQTIYHTFKEELISIARARAKDRIPKLDRRIKETKDDLRKTLNDPRTPESREAQEHACYLQERVARLEIQRFGHARTQMAARDWLEGETISKYWVRLNAQQRPDKVIYEMEDPNARNESEKYTNNSAKMAEVAKDFYDSLQDDPMANESERRQATRDTLENVDVRLSDRERQRLDREIDEDEVEEAVLDAATGKSPGLDGIPTELWKELLRRQRKDEKRNKPTFKVTRALKTVFNDIEMHGVEPGTDFNKGWICPIYKKKDKRQIGNYRPITLLNADYKILTRTLATRLAVVAPSLIHPDQAGFISGRQIFHHIKLTKLMINQAEAEETNGCIVALDQEKAYDRINHRYLWEVLDHMGLPEHFIRTVKHLYTDAKSVVIVNGETSEAFTVIRGVRQGDPMSCLLFNLAIEPLACALRKSDLEGFELTGLRERLIAMLFADDTTVYLSETDNYADLEDILERWCRASRAKFNGEKTEVVPIGTREYRDKVVRTRSLGPRSIAFPAAAKIASQGAAVRILGAWVGNGVDERAPWLPIIATIKKNLERWGLRNPTIYARKHIVSMEIGGRTQFLTRAQSMPNDIEAEIQQLALNFVWNGDKHPVVNRETLYRKIEQGGLNLLDLKARNEAIDLVGLKEYLTTGPSRPKWAAIADNLLAKAVAASSRNVDSTARINTFLQKWNVSTRQSAGLPRDLRRMVAAANKYEVRIEANNPARELRDLLPIWYHLGTTVEKIMGNSPSNKCLRENHRVVTVLDCMGVAARIRGCEDHRNSPACPCDECHHERVMWNCGNPARCAEAAQKLITQLMPKWTPMVEPLPKDGLSLTKSRKRKNVVATAEHGRIIFNPSLEDGPGTEAVMRVFCGPPDLPSHAVRRAPKPFGMVHEEIEVYTDGSCEGNGDEDAKAGSGLWYGTDDPRNKSLKVPGDKTNQTAELYAVEAALDGAPPFAPLHVVTDSKHVIRGMTENLGKWEDNGWIGIAHPQQIRRLVAKLRARSAPTTFRWVKGHSGNEGNEAADRLAKRGASRRRIGPIQPAKLEFLRRGAKLSTVTQKTLYRGIRCVAEVASGSRPRTDLVMGRVQDTIEEVLKFRPRQSTLWKNLKNRDVSRKARAFLWKGMHDGLRVGRYWEHIPGYETRAMCTICLETESLEHVLHDCEAKSVRIIWGLVRALATRKGVTLPELCFGLTLAGPSFSMRALME